MIVVNLIVISGHFSHVFPSQESNNISNPFSAPMLWTASNVTNGHNYVNPFQAVDPLKLNGISYGFPASSVPTVVNGTAWTPNPFKVTLFVVYCCLTINFILFYSWGQLQGAILVIPSFDYFHDSHYLS